MATQFDFNIATDFPNGQVDLSVLTAELEGSTIGTESGASLEGLSLIASQPPGDIGDPPPPIDTCRIEWDTDLTPNEEATQASVVGDHQGIPFVEGTQRETVIAEQTTPDSGWLQVAELVSGDLNAGDYNLSVSFEISTLNSTSNSGVQAQVRFNGSEVSLSSSGLNVYDTRSISQPITVQAADNPSVEIRIRRVGVANTARIRRIRIALSKIQNGEVE